MRIAFLTNKTAFGKQGYELLKNSDLDIVFESFGNKNLDIKKVDYDYLISFCYPYKVSKNILDIANVSNVNFHPAPLPYYRGFSVYNFGILNQESEWGTTAHIMEDKFDTGDIVCSNKFDICKNTETAFSLREKSRIHLIKLLNEFIESLVNNIQLKTTKQKGESKYFSKKMLNEFRIIKDDDSRELVDRKIRAFWCPPYSGAAVIIKEKEYTIVNDTILKNNIQY
jgi:methionyl-tRNA formyltransferase